MPSNLFLVDHEFYFDHDHLGPPDIRYGETGFRVTADHDDSRPELTEPQSLGLDDQALDEALAAVYVDNGAGDERIADHREHRLRYIVGPADPACWQAGGHGV